MSSTSNFNPKIKKTLLGLSAYYGFDIPDEQLHIWLAVLSDVNPDSFQKIAMDLLRDSSVTKMPNAARLRDYAKAGRVLSEDLDSGLDVAGRIWEAIGKYGPYRESEARAALGELSWQVIMRMGGWSSLQNIEDSERGTFFAQARDQAAAIQRMSRKGLLNQPTAIAAPTNAKVQGLINQATRALGEKE